MDKLSSSHENKSNVKQTRAAVPPDPAREAFTGPVYGSRSSLLAKMNEGSLAPSNMIGLQRTIGNRAVTNLIAHKSEQKFGVKGTITGRPSNPPPNRPKPIVKPRDIQRQKPILKLAKPGLVQRMILPIIRTKEQEKEIMEQAQKQKSLLNHGVVVKEQEDIFDQRVFVNRDLLFDLSSIGLNEDLYIIGHGSPDHIGGKSPKALAEYVVNTLKLSLKYKGKILLQACQSGTLTMGGDTYMEMFQKEIVKLGVGVDVAGYAGPVILDDAMPGYVKMRVIRPGMTLELFKKAALAAADDAANRVKELVKLIKENDPDVFLAEDDLQEIKKYQFLTYEVGVRKFAEPENEGLTQIAIKGVRKSLPSVQPADLDQTKQAILDRMDQKKKEFENMPTEVLDLSVLMSSSSK